MSLKEPSLEAIRRFKEQQEQKKRLEDERKIKEKLSTLEHRSTHGDRKAKQVLKKIRDTIDKPPPEPKPSTTKSLANQHQRGSSQNTSTQSIRPRPKAKAVETDFEELMKLAKQNNNQVREKPKPQPSPSPEPVRIPKKKPQPGPEPVRHQPKSKPTEPSRRSVASKAVPEFRKAASPAPPARNLPPKSIPQRGGLPPARNQLPRNFPPHGYRPRPQMPSSSRYEDDYESDGFVVSDEDDDARAELTETLRSVFRYDRRRCDEREQELDRQYRAIGNVSTFEDLEREERRAARLAAAEDAKALREEEERKRLKKLRFEKAAKRDRG